MFCSLLLWQWSSVSTATIQGIVGSFSAHPVFIVSMPLVGALFQYLIACIIEPDVFHCGLDCTDVIFSSTMYGGISAISALAYVAYVLLVQSWLCNLVVYV